MNSNSHNKSDVQQELMKIGMGVCFDVLEEIDNLLEQHLGSKYQSLD